MIRSLWPALATLGAGLIFFALAAGSPVIVAAPLVLLALLHVCLGLTVLRAGRPVLRKTTLACCGAATAINATLFLSGSAGIVPFVALLALHWGIALAVALDLRGRRRAPVDRRPASVMIVLVSGAMIVAAITTPALAFTEPGTAAVPHGEHQQHH
jgi:hypothetical protein